MCVGACVCVIAGVGVFMNYICVWSGQHSLCVSTCLGIRVFMKSMCVCVCVCVFCESVSEWSGWDFALGITIGWDRWPDGRVKPTRQDTGASPTEDQGQHELRSTTGEPQDLHTVGRP